MKVQRVTEIALITPHFGSGAERESEGHSVYVSEYNAPKDFICVWEKQVKESMSLGERGFRTEKLFKYEPLLG